MIPSAHWLARSTVLSRMRAASRDPNRGRPTTRSRPRIYGAIRRRRGTCMISAACRSCLVHDRQQVQGPRDRSSPRPRFPPSHIRRPRRHAHRLLPPYPRRLPQEAAVTPILIATGCEFPPFPNLPSLFGRSFVRPRAKRRAVGRRRNRSRTTRGKERREQMPQCLRHRSAVRIQQRVLETTRQLDPPVPPNRNRRRRRNSTILRRDT